MSSNRTTESNELHLLSNELKTRLKSIKDIDAKRKEYCRLLEEWDWKYGVRGTEILLKLMNCKSLFPSVEDRLFFLKVAVTGRLWGWVKYLEESGLKIHEFMFEDGKSALHYLAGVYESLESIDYKTDTTRIITYFFENNLQIYCDNHGYTYLHGACLAGNEEAVNALLSEEGVDVNIDTYTRSLLYIACQHRRENCVKILLEHGANPNKGDREQRSTPLHALALPCLCDCVAFSDYSFNFCDYKRPVDEIVKLLIDKGAQIEARDLHGDTPLQSAVSRFDVELTRALLKYGASFSNLNEDRMFSANFTSIEMKCYPLTFNMIQMMQLLQSAGYKMDFLTRLKMMKCWTRIRGNEIDYIIGDEMRDEKDEQDSSLFMHIVDLQFILNEFGFYMEKKVIDYLNQCREKLKSRSSSCRIGYQPHELVILYWRESFEQMKNIKITEEVSLYQFFQMSSSEGYSVLKNLKDWRIPPIDLPQHSDPIYTCSVNLMHIIVKRNMANILIRPWLDLELLAADLFMTDYCSLNLPQNVCLEVAQNLSDEDLFRLFEQINIDAVIDQQSEYDNSRIRFVRLTL
ncbi:uncharacterized protein LOC111693390 [Trichogramma pretiosum]|uniref:uncharacterized protein LOC111693390 n=1 Tax=Trichogramma pretiosum TaxID=7493 RepID=UPI000C71BDE2|nr:uncharacterized protein LOC111693390 [Trichogramma pretiosum]